MPPVPPVPPPPSHSTLPAILGETFNHHGNGIAGATPIADVWIQGIPCAAHAAISFHRNGRLASATLARAHAIAGEQLAARTQVGFETDGRLAVWVAAAAAPFATRVLGAAKTWLPVTIPAGSKITMERGQLRDLALAGPLAFDDLAFPTGTELTFGDSGALSHVSCREPLELRGIRWAAHEPVVFEFGYLREGYPDDDGTYDDVPYQAGEVIRLHDNGRLARCYLARDLELSGVPCLGGTRIYRDEHGHLVEGTLASDTTLAGVPVAAEGVVGLEAGTPTALTPREDVELDGILCAKGQLVELTTVGRLVRATLGRDEVRDTWRIPAGSIVVFDAAKLRVLVVANATTPAGRTLAGWWRVELAADGSIVSLLPSTHAAVGRSLTLREAATVAELTAAAGSNVELRADGSVKSLVLAADQHVGTHLAKAGTRVHFHSNQQPSNLYLAAVTVIDGVPCAAAVTLGAVMNGVEHTYREEVRLDETGALRYAMLAADTTVAGMRLARGHTLARWETGALHVGTLAQRSTHALGCVARERTLFGQFEDGSPSLLTLAEPFTVAGTEYPAGTVLSFTSPGVLGSSADVHVPLGPCEPCAPLAAEPPGC